MKKKPITFKLPPWMICGLDLYRDHQAVAPDRTAVVEAAIEKFLKENGISRDEAERQGACDVG